MVPTLRSELFDSQKFVVDVFVDFCDLHRSSSLLWTLLFDDVETNTNILESLRYYWPILNALFK